MTRSRPGARQSAADRARPGAPRRGTRCRTPAPTRTPPRVAAPMVSVGSMAPAYRGYPARAAKELAVNPESPKLSGALARGDTACHACGYNLRGVRAVFCPECGTVIPAVVDGPPGRAGTQRGKLFWWLTVNTFAGLLLA